MANSSAFSLMAEDKPAQASFTRLQMYLGLREKEMIISNLSYGQPLPKLFINKPSAYTRYGNVQLVSLEVKLVWNGDSLTAASTFGSCKFDTASLSKIAPKNLVESIGSLKTSGLRWKPTDDIKHRLGSKAPNILSSQIDGLFQPSAQNFVLLLADKEKTVRDLKSIGFDLNEQKQRLHIVDVLDISDLIQAYTFRTTCKLSAPLAFEHNFQVTRRNETFEKAVEAPERASEDTSALQEKAKAGLRDAVRMAVDNACDPGQLLFREQVDGGNFDEQASFNSAPRDPPAPHVDAVPYKLEPPKALMCDERLPGELAELVGVYQDAGARLLEWFIYKAGFDINARDGKGKATSISNRHIHIEIEYPERPEIPFRSTIPFPYVKTRCYRFLASNVASTLPQDVADDLETILYGRIALLEWHKRLPPTDQRVQYNDRHEAHINVMWDVLRILCDRDKMPRTPCSSE